MRGYESSGWSPEKRIHLPAPALRLRRVVLLAACIAGVFLVQPGCSAHQRVHTETVLARALISDHQAAQIGTSMHQELQAQGVRFVSDPVIIRYVDSIAARVIPRARRERPGITFRVFVIDDPGQVNAFATPGGYLYIYSGLIKVARSEAEVAGVLGHEAAHVSRLHIERGMVNSYGLSALISMALGEDPGAIKQIVAGLAASGIMAAHGRSEEIEADEHGARYAAAGGYDPRAMVSFFQTLRSMSGSGGGPAFLRSHPTSSQRISNLNDYIRENNLARGEMDPASHRAVASRIGG